LRNTPLSSKVMMFHINDSLYSLISCGVDISPYAFDTELLPDVKELAPSSQLIVSLDIG
jgi:hypothetical protein